MSEIASSQPHTKKISRLVVALGIIWLAMFAIAVTGFPNLMDNERRVGAYVQDAVQNGNWIGRRDATGDIVSKPPLLIWIASLVTLPIGHLTRFALYLPSALGTVGTVWLVLLVGRARFGLIAGFLGASIYLLSP